MYDMCLVFSVVKTSVSDVAENTVSQYLALFLRRNEKHSYTFTMELLN